MYSPIYYLRSVKLNEVLKSFMSREHPNLASIMILFGYSGTVFLKILFILVSAATVKAIKKW